MAAFGWIKSGWSLAQQAASIVKDIADLKAAVATLTARVGALEERSSPRPEDLRLHSGVYWGRFPPGGPRQAYCPVCCAEGTYTPLSRLGEGVYSEVLAVAYSCPKCNAGFHIKPEEERQVLGE